MNSTPSNLADWLSTLESRHPKAIDMGLERVAQVRDALGLRFDCPVITVGGTNGKGSTCAMMEAILLQAGYKVGLYTSPPARSSRTISWWPSSLRWRRRAAMCR
jgi:dihydrofolate synthase/folylpolyglutamate synthase